MLGDDPDHFHPQLRCDLILELRLWYFELGLSELLPCDITRLQIQLWRELTFRRSPIQGWFTREMHWPVALHFRVQVRRLLPNRLWSMADSVCTGCLLATRWDRVLEDQTWPGKCLHWAFDLFGVLFYSGAPTKDSSHRCQNRQHEPGYHRLVHCRGRYP